MNHNTQYNIIAGVSGALAASWQNVKNLLQAPVVKYTYQIDWAETFQISWKAAVGAIVGLSGYGIKYSIVKNKKVHHDLQHHLWPAWCIDLHLTSCTFLPEGLQSCKYGIFTKKIHQFRGYQYYSFSINSICFGFDMGRTFKEIPKD